MEAMKKIRISWGNDEKMAGVLLTLAACFMFFIYSPLELYFTNKNEFWFDFPLLFGSMIIVFLTLFAVG